jgi:hypothetical protein
MSVEQAHRGFPARRRLGPAYFVGRRHAGAAEVYEVSAGVASRLRSGRGDEDLDWRGTSAARLELGELVISRIAEQRPSRELQARFALYVLSTLPHDGFVVDVDDIWGWVLAAADEQDFLPAQSAPRSWGGRLRSLLPSVSAGGSRG